MTYRGWFASLVILLVLILHIGAAPEAHTQERGPVYRVEVQDITTSVTIDFLRRALREAEASNATALIIEIGSEGAVLRAIRPFAADIADARVPVVTYVAPPGTESGAVGAFFLSASHIAAMAPDTSFGTPVPLAEVDETLSEQTQALVLDSVAQQLREWNEQHGRSTAWVDAAVREGVVRTSQQAIAADPPAIDIVASDRDELLTLLDGRVVALPDGEEVELPPILEEDITLIEPNAWESFLLWLANPTVAFLLLVLGAIAIYAELTTPGIGVAAGIGAMLLLGALVGFLVLPVNWLSVAGLVLAFGLIASDIFLPTHGGLTVAGLVVLLISALTLIDAAQAPNVFVALWAILVVVLSLATVAAVAVWLVVRTRNTPISTGQESLVGRLAEVRKPLTPDGLVFVDGALWRAISEDGTIEQGDWVRISAVHDLRLVVRRIDTEGEPFAG
jgi:membrane-bound serine protease (ClpP class)